MSSDFLDPFEQDCYLRALPGEPRFTLLGRDRFAYDTIMNWGDKRELDVLRGNYSTKDELRQELIKITNARDLANKAKSWRASNMGIWRIQKPEQQQERGLLVSSILTWCRTQTTAHELWIKYSTHFTSQAEFAQFLFNMTNNNLLNYAIDTNTYTTTPLEL